MKMPLFPEQMGKQKGGAVISVDFAIAFKYLCWVKSLLTLFLTLR